jgi:hypothetical protein
VYDQTVEFMALAGGELGLLIKVSSVSRPKNAGKRGKTGGRESDETVR